MMHTTPPAAAAADDDGLREYSPSLHQHNRHVGEGGNKYLKNYNCDSQSVHVCVGSTITLFNGWLVGWLAGGHCHCALHIEVPPKNPPNQHTITHTHCPHATIMHDAEFLIKSGINSHDNVAATLQHERRICTWREKYR